MGESRVMITLGSPRGEFNSDMLSPKMPTPPRTPNSLHSSGSSPRQPTSPSSEDRPMPKPPGKRMLGRRPSSRIVDVSDSFPSSGESSNGSPKNQPAQGKGLRRIQSSARRSSYSETHTPIVQAEDVNTGNNVPRLSRKLSSMRMSMQSRYNAIDSRQEDRENTRHMQNYSDRSISPRKPESEPLHLIESSLDNSSLEQKTSGSLSPVTKQKGNALSHFDSVSKDEMHKNMQFSLGKLIGSGTYGKVYLILAFDSGKQYAMKRLRCDSDDDAWVKSTEAEIEIMKKLKHENIVRYIGVQQTIPGHLDIILENMTGGSLANLLEQHGALPIPLVAKFTKQIVQGMKYLHDNGIIHRDIKGANVLLNEHGVAKLGDFGCSRQLAMIATNDGTLNTIKGSIPWMAPEMIKQTGVTVSADIWSLGATVLEMLTGTRPWPDLKDHVNALFVIGNTQTPPPMPSSIKGTTVENFLLQCFVIDPRKRATIGELRDHAFCK